ncbi:ATP-binding cassette domain-containing protein [Salicibibacter cibi]|uniref:ATP-binding cassette domain-containing protein n=1 Tax=Salicibibacter cibi TaxID=2743001 RepID=A0A7T6Z817_9BACI|nr:ATP-binding cassette domain-containing protein [Salicibibacter cibi]QQK78675.1 ATP-binding cassette domain-containing protein [Salicibibacter cibi]
MAQQTHENAIEIKLEQIHKSFGNNEVLHNINVTVDQGQFVAIVGKSGSGKSTLLRLIAGLEEINEGTLLFNDEEPRKSQASVTMMYQDSRLLPWKKVIDNVGIGLKGKWKEHATEVLEAVGLTQFSNEWPATLSGGQQQRVALARALVRDPQLLMLDEPLSALDALTRTEMQDWIEKIWLDNGFTALLVTHDVREAVRLADRILLIEDGEITLDLTNSEPRPRNVSNERMVALEKQVFSRILKEE